MKKKAGRPPKDMTIAREEAEFEFLLIRYIYEGEKILEPLFSSEDTDFKSDKFKKIMKTKILRGELLITEEKVLKIIQDNVNKLEIGKDSVTGKMLRWLVARLILLKVYKDYWYSDKIHRCFILLNNGDDDAMLRFFKTYLCHKQFREANGGPKPLHAEYIILPFINDILTETYGKKTIQKIYDLIYSNSIKDILKERKTPAPEFGAFRKTVGKAIEYRDEEMVMSQFFITLVALIKFVNENKEDEILNYFNLLEALASVDELGYDVAKSQWVDKYDFNKIWALKISVRFFLDSPSVSNEIHLNSFISENVRRGFFPMK